MSAEVRPTPSSPSHVPEPPRLLLAAASAALLGSLVILFWGAVTIGVTYDEPYHVMRLQHWFDHGWYLLNDDLVNGEVGEWVDDSFVYGPVATLLLHLVNVALGNETWGTVGGGSDSYAVRHLAVAAMSFVAVLATAALGRVLLRSWRWGVVCAAALVVVPLWTGMAMVNVKDTPVAVGYTLVTLGLVLLVGETPARWRLPVAGLLTWAGGLLAVGVRPGIWPGIAAAYGLVALLLLVRRPGGTRPALARLAVATTAGVATLVVLAFVYPAVFADPDWVLRSVFSSANYRGESTPRHTAPVQVFGVVPTLLLVLSLAAWGRLARRARPRSWRLDVPSTRWLLVGLQALLIASLAIAKGSQLHGLRQMLFAMPAVAVLAVWGLSRWIAATQSPHASRAGSQAASDEPMAPSRWPARVLVAAVAVSLLTPTLVQARLFPYSYGYSSAMVDLSGAITSNDYWRGSYRELAPLLTDDEFLVCSGEMISGQQTYARLTRDGGRSPVERSRDCRTDYLSPFGPYRSFDVAVDEPVGTTFLMASSGSTDPGRLCTDLAQVERHRHLRVHRMSVLRRCQLVLLDLPDARMTFTPEGHGSEFLMGGWTGNRSDPGVELLDRRGDLGFALPDLDDARPVEVALSLEHDVTVEVLVDNVRLGRWAPGAGVRRLTVPAGWGRVVEGGLVITVRAAEGGEVRMLTVQVDEAKEARR
ncbi:hypothetical protein [Nocardioides jishulii]|uniref:Glycosyltransferase RgtA/B/C/D-like domain-containing protein n=1 Tax=Nocardioides jishulii TaxID=2575440 RepID=A0A4U2YLY6_9ACTN|nr:hypothetical protein [Nocardioides jishulii]QCX27131.1 hypothetical protein FCL41_06000 [Nocardioides jishulii]TKI61615.1 hypothetical protein FC770_12635 [Nocardioides jishulii]